MKYYVAKHQPGNTVQKQLTPAQKKAWYKGRYTPDEIKEMQLQLYKTGLYDIEITGEPTDEFLAAVLDYQTKFQKSTGADMLLDGLVGDQTAAAMGLRLSSANRGYTVHGRAGQMRTAEPSAQNQKIVDYANKPEMVRFLVTPANTKENKELQKKYIKQYYQYLSPENKRKVYTHWDGWHEELGITKPGEEDAELDEHLKNVQEIAKLYNEKQQGMGNLPDMIASGTIRSGDYYNEDLEKYIKQYNLSPEEAALVLNSEAGSTAKQIGMYNHEAGQQRTEAKQMEEMQQHVREGRDKFAAGTANLLANTVYLPYALGVAAVTGDKSHVENGLGKSFSQMYGVEQKPLTNGDGSINWSGVKNSGINVGLDILMNPFTLANTAINLPKMGQNFLAQGRNLRVYTPGSHLPHGTYKMGNNVFSPTNFHYDGRVPVNGRLVQPRTPNGKFTPLTAMGKNSPNSGLGFTGTIGDELAYRAKVSSTTKIPMNQWQLGNTPMSKINSSKEIPFVPLTTDMLGSGVASAGISTALGHTPDLSMGTSPKTNFIAYTPADISFSTNPAVPQQQSFVSETGVRPAATTGTEGDAIATYISEINSMKANDPDNPLIQQYEAILKQMGVPSNKKGGCMYKKGKRMKK